MIHSTHRAQDFFHFTFFDEFLSSTFTTVFEINSDIISQKAELPLVKTTDTCVRFSQQIAKEQKNHLHFGAWHLSQTET